MKHTKRNSVLILIITVLILYILLKDDYKNILNVLSSVNVFYLIITIILYFLYFLFDQLTIYTLIRQYNYKCSLGFSLYLGGVRKFFSGITPLATGGQPMEVYTMHKKGIPLSIGTNIVIQNYIVFQIALMIIGITSILLNQIFHYFEYIPLLRQLTIIGFVANFIILIVLFLLSFSKKFNKTLVKFTINLLSKIKIVKNREEQIKKWDKKCDNYYENARVLFKHKKVFILGIILQFISIIIYYFLPLVIAYSLSSSNNLSVISTIVASSYVFIMGCYVPIPGATGGMEYGFLGFFGNFLGTSEVKALLIVWRFITYYAPTIIGAIIFNIGNSKSK